MTPENYIASFSFDRRLAPYDVRGSIAHVTMLAAKKIIPHSESKKIIAGLKSIARDIEKGKRIPKAEDIHFAIEAELIRRIGHIGKKMHTARSRNDQVVTDLKLYIRDVGAKIIEEITKFQKAILSCSVKYQTVIMPGFTHLQHGQPIFFAHHLLAYAWMAERDKDRFRNALNRMDESPLGTCALAGTSFRIDRNMTAKILGFSRVTENSIDTVSDRDFIAEFIFDCALTMIHLSRLAEELIIWSSTEFSFVTLADPFVSGSSIMPQKRNPDSAELVRGKSSRTIGGLVQFLSLLKSQPLSYNRDLQEDKPPLFDSADTTALSLSISSEMVETMTVHPQKMKESCKGGYLLATELADYLTRKGMPFREAHAVVSDIICELRQDPDGRENLEELSLEELKSFSPLFHSDVYRILSLTHVASDRNSYGGTGVRALSNQIKKLKTFLK